jgi:hypothetical protein
MLVRPVTGLRILGAVTTVSHKPSLRGAWTQAHVILQTLEANDWFAWRLYGHRTIWRHQIIWLFSSCLNTIMAAVETWGVNIRQLSLDVHTRSSRKRKKHSFYHGRFCVQDAEHNSASSSWLASILFLHVVFIKEGITGSIILYNSTPIGPLKGKFLPQFRRSSLSPVPYAPSFGALKRATPAPAFIASQTAWALTSWSTVLLEKPPVAQPLKNFSTFYGTRSFLTVFTSALHWPGVWLSPSELLSLVSRSSIGTHIDTRQHLNFQSLEII